jgi:hypothetical protein
VKMPEVRIAEAKLKKAIISRDSLQEDVRHYREMFRDGSMGGNRMEAAELELALAEQDVIIAQATLEIVESSHYEATPFQPPGENHGQSCPAVLD